MLNSVNIVQNLKENKTNGFKKMETIKEYILKQTFSLKDFEKTYNKYKNYKKDKTNNFFKENKQDILNHLEDLKDLIETELNNKPFITELLLKEGLKKKYIKMFKTSINGITYNKNLEFFDYYNLNKNEIRNFTIILYLRYYKEINKIMVNVFRDYLKDFEKKRVLHNLKN